MAHEQSQEMLGTIEQALADHRPFANSAYIRSQLQVCLTRRLERIAERVPAARELLDVIERAQGHDLHRVLGDTVVRCAILHAHIQLETAAPYGLPLAQCEQIFTGTCQHIEQGRFDTPLADGSLFRSGPEPHHGWIWNEDHADDLFGRSFRFLLKDRYQALPRTPSSEEVDLLTRGGKLLETLLPTLAPSALSHVVVIACVPNAGQWKGTASSSQFHLGGTVFVGQSIPSTWWVAEHLLHEALHQKLYDFRQAHSLLELDYSRGDAPRVYSPWNPPQLSRSNQWDVHRVFAAFHVYVNLALLAIVAEQRAEELAPTYGTFQAIMSSRKALERAHYLGQKLKDECWNELGLAGQRLAEWLMTALEFLDPAPPPRGAYVHLCFDRYETEANRVAAALKECESAAWSLPRRLAPLATEEIESARRLLTAINAREQLDELDKSVAGISEEELGTKFPEVRCAVGRALINASATSYQFTESGEQDELLRDMIETASHGVFAALSRYPRGVADAMRRAHDLGFTMSCDESVGRMLAALAAAVPRGGRILEIGTGTGVGTAWIVEGLGERTDVEVYSVEIDSRLTDATRAWPWPDFVHIVTGDALEQLDTLGTFNLVFADASPIKYNNVESVLASVRAGGMLVMDDLGGPSYSERQRADKAGLRRVLTNHPGLHTVEMEWSTGVVLATKRLPMVDAPVVPQAAAIQSMQGAVGA